MSEHRRSRSGVSAGSKEREDPEKEPREKCRKGEEEGNNIKRNARVFALFPSSHLFSTQLLCFSAMWPLNPARYTNPFRTRTLVDGKMAHGVDNEQSSIEEGTGGIRVPEIGASEYSFCG